MKEGFRRISAETPAKRELPSLPWLIVIPLQFSDINHTDGHFSSRSIDGVAEAETFLGGVLLNSKIQSFRTCYIDDGVCKMRSTHLALLVFKM